MPIHLPSWLHPMLLPSNLISSARKALEERGLIYTLVRAAQLPQRIAIGWYIGMAGRAFDRRHGTETSEIVEFPDHLVTSGNQFYGNSYVPTPPMTFHRIMRSLDVRCNDFTFIDFGSGKGRAVILALEYGFKKTVGIEYSVPLHNSAVKNVQALRDRHPANFPLVELFCSDAATFDFCHENQVLYFANPFSEKVMQPLLVNLSIATRMGSSFPTIYLVHIASPKFSLDILFRNNNFILVKKLRIIDFTGIGRDVLIYRLMPYPHLSSC